MHLSYRTPDGTGTGTGTFTSFGRFGTMNARESDFPTTKTQTVFSHIRKGNGRREPTRHPTFQCCKRETETNRFFLFCTLVETNSCREGRRCRPATRLSDCAPRVPLTVCHVNQKKKKSPHNAIKRLYDNCSRGCHLRPASARPTRRAPLDTSTLHDASEAVRLLLEPSRRFDATTCAAFSGLAPKAG